MSFNLLKAEGFEWDEGNLEHIKKHRVNLEECQEVFFNKPLLLSKDEEHSEGEERFKALGVTNNKRLILLVFTLRNNKIRIISGRDQNKKERMKLQQIGGENL